MKFKSQVLTQASGSVGGLTYSHNKGGMYMRARSIPINPNTVQQQAIRSAVGQLTSLWLNTVTAVQRAAWTAYALAVPLLDQFGDPRVVTALNHYVRSNVPRLQVGLPRVDTAPIIFNLGDFTAVAMDTLTEAGQTYAITLDNTDDWANEDDAALLIYSSRAKNPSITFFKGPYRFADKVDGDGVTPPTSPATIATPFPFALGQLVFSRAIVTRADGRLSLSQAMFSTAVA